MEKDSGYPPNESVERFEKKMSSIVKKIKGEPIRDERVMSETDPMRDRWGHRNRALPKEYDPNTFLGKLAHWASGRKRQDKLEEARRVVRKDSQDLAMKRHAERERGK